MRKIFYLFVMTCFCMSCSQFNSSNSARLKSNSSAFPKTIFKEGYNTNLGELHKTVNTFDDEVGDALKIAPAHLKDIELSFKEADVSGKYYYSVRTTALLNSNASEKRNAFSHRGSISDGKTLQLACEQSSKKVKDQLEEFELNYSSKGYQNLQYPDSWRFQISFKDSSDTNWCLVEQFFWFYIQQ